MSDDKPTERELIQALEQLYNAHNIKDVLELIKVREKAKDVINRATGRCMVCSGRGWTWRHDIYDREIQYPCDSCEEEK